jgi:hypothetical protein
MLVDFHTHVFPPFLVERREEYLARDATFGELYSSPKARMATAEELVAALDDAEVDAAVMVGIGWTDRELAARANDYLLEAAIRFPGRLIPFCVVNPAWGEDAVREMQRCVKGGARGMGELHPDSQGFDLTSGDAMSPLMGEARKSGIPVMVHSSEPVGHPYPGKGRATPERLLRFIERFPQNVIVCAHWGGGLPFYALMPEVSTALRNVYFDSAASPFLYAPKVFRVARELVGADRILFGTDYPLISHKRLLEQVREAGLPPQEEAAVLGGNAVRLLRLEEAKR